MGSSASLSDSTREALKRLPHFTKAELEAVVAAARNEALLLVSVDRFEELTHEHRVARDHTGSLDAYLNAKLTSNWAVRDTLQKGLCRASSEMSLDLHSCARDPARKVRWSLGEAEDAEDDEETEDDDEREDEDEREGAEELGFVTYRFAHHLTSAWRKQPSPCCAGAALSCCVNALQGHSRDSAAALSVFDGCRLLADATRQRGQFFARGLPPRLQIPSLAPMLEAVHQQLLQKGELRLAAVKKQQLREAVAAVARSGEFPKLERLYKERGAEDDAEEEEVGEAGEADAGLPPWSREKAPCECGASAWDAGARQRKGRGFCDACGRVRAEQCTACGVDRCVACLYPNRRNDAGFYVAPCRQNSPSRFYCGRISLAGELSCCGPDEAQCDACKRFQMRAEERSGAAVEEWAAGWGSGWGWKHAEEELLDWLLREKIVAQLCDPKRPSTSKIGNAGIVSAVRLIGLDATRFLGLESETDAGVENVISCKDGPEEREAQWELVKAAMQSSVLLFHLTNHYCPIYAWREIERDGEVERELLTSRAGQRPTAWIRWDECLKIMRKWAGYKILRLVATVQALAAR